MVKEKKSKTNVLGTEIIIFKNDNEDFICLTDMAKRFGVMILYTAG